MSNLQTIDRFLIGSRRRTRNLLECRPFILPGMYISRDFTFHLVSSFALNEVHRENRITQSKTVKFKLRYFPFYKY